MRPKQRIGSRMPARKANEFGFRARTLERKEAGTCPGRRHGSRTAAGKANEFGFRARTLCWEKREIEPGRRHGSRTAAGKANEFGFLCANPGTGGGGNEAQTEVRFAHVCR